MKDDIFNTLLAVAMMCMGHFHGTLDGRTLEPADNNWDKGFENCALVIKRRDGERERRAKLDAENKEALEKVRLINAMEALAGRKFEAEQAPEPPLPDTCIMNTGVSDMMPFSGDHGSISIAPGSTLGSGTILTPGKVNIGPGSILAPGTVLNPSAPK